MDDTRGPVERLSAVTLLTADMGRAVEFYRTLGLRLRYGGADAEFTSFVVGDGFLNLQLDRSRSRESPIWGRFILWVDDVDATFAACAAAGYCAGGEPADAPWGERYFHIRDPDGHEVSVARPLER